MFVPERNLHETYMLEHAAACDKPRNVISLIGIDPIIDR